MMSYIMICFLVFILYVASYFSVSHAVPLLDKNIPVTLTVN